MSKLKIFLKSGHTIDVECESWKFTHNEYSGLYTGYEFNGLKTPKSLGIVISEIVGYIVLE